MVHAIEYDTVAARPAAVRHDPDGVITDGLLDVAALERITARGC